MLDFLYLGFSRFDECSLVCDDLFQTVDESADFLGRHPPIVVFGVANSGFERAVVVRSFP